MLLDVLRHGRTDIAPGLTPEEREKERSLDVAVVSVSSQLRRESSLPKPDNTKIAAMEDRLRQARLEYEAYETRIYAAHPELRVQRGESPPLTLKEMEGLITDDQTALLEYVVTQKKTYLFVLTRKAQTKPDDRDVANVELNVHSIPVAQTELSRRVGAFRQTLARNSPAFKESARESHDLLLLPAQKELTGKTRVCVVPFATCGSRLSGTAFAVEQIRA